MLKVKSREHRWELGGHPGAISRLVAQRLAVEAPHLGDIPPYIPTSTTIDRLPRLPLLLRLARSLVGEDRGLAGALRMAVLTAHLTPILEACHKPSS